MILPTAALTERANTKLRRLLADHARSGGVFIDFTCTTFRFVPTVG